VSQTVEPIAGRYELVEPLKAGGMGQVWRGYDSVLDREVAIKLIRPDVIATPEQAEEFAKRFRREARLTARIAHHGVPQVFDAVLDDSYERVCLVMEFVHGTSLRAFIDPDRPLPVAWAAAIGAQVCTVLSHAHAIPAVHRDLKPDNVLVTEAGAVKLLDFGIAAILRTDVTRLTATGSPIGTSRYMSPEQIQGAQITPHSDLYALGCVLHELLCGQHPFSGGTEFQLMQQHVSQRPRPLRELRADVPQELERLVRDLLAKQPEQRPADAYQVYQRLLPLLPPPGAPPPEGAADLGAMPDPTLIYRLPNAPRLRRDEVPATTATTTAPAAAGDADEVLEAVKVAVMQSDALLAEERFAQAAEVLQKVIGPAGAALGQESPRVLRLRARRAATLVLAGEFRQALPEFDALAAAYGRTAGSTSTEALDCLRQAAYCRAELGQTTTALRQFQQVLGHVRDAEGDAGPTALDLRRNIGILLLSEGRLDESLAELRPLFDDLRVAYGPDHDATQEVGDILARLRLASDPGPAREVR
jgi:eukaryotic-like serine/threonine-protein kinase